MRVGGKRGRARATSTSPPCKRVRGGRGKAARAQPNCGNDDEAPDVAAASTCRRSRSKGKALNPSTCASCAAKLDPSTAVAKMDRDDTQVRMCGKCMKTYLDGFSFMDPGDFVEEKNTPNSQVAIDFAAATKVSNGGEREFAAQSVIGASLREISVARKYTAMNEAEFKQEFKVAPLQKHVRHAPSAQVPSESNPEEMETVWLFTWDPLSPYRTVTMGYKLTAEKKETLMHESQHLYDGQADSVLGFKSTANSEEWSVSVPEKAKSTAAWKAKLGTHGAGVSGADSSPAKPMPPQQDALSAHTSAAADASFAGRLEEEDGMNAEAGADDVDEALPQIKVVAGGLVANRRGLTPSLAKGTASVKGSAGGRSRSPMKKLGSFEARSVADTSVGDDVSDAGSAKTAKTGRGMLADPNEEVVKWRNRLELNKIMQGHGDLQLYHAEQSATKLHDKGYTNEAQQLRAYLKLVLIAKSLRPSNLDKLSMDELKAGLTTVARHSDFPPEVLVAVARAHLKQALGGASEKDGFQNFLKMAWPWPLGPDAEAKFDVLEPRVCYLPLNTLDRAEIFDHFVSKGILSRLIAGGSAQKQNLVSVCKALAQQAGNVLGEESQLTEEVSSYLCELMSATTSLPILADPGKLLLDPDADEQVEAISQLQNAATDINKSFLQQIALAVQGAEFYEERMAMILRASGPLAELIPIVQAGLDAVKAIGGSDNGVAEKSALLASVLRDLPRVTAAGIHTVLSDGYKEDVKSAVIALTEQASSMKDLTKDDYSSLTSVLQDASTCFPFDKTINEMMTFFGEELGKVSQARLVEAVTAKLEEFNTVTELTAENFTTLHDSVKDMNGVRLDDGSVLAVEAAIRRIFDTEGLHSEESLADKLSLVTDLAGVLPIATEKHPALEGVRLLEQMAVVGKESSSLPRSENGHADLEKAAGTKGMASRLQAQHNALVSVLAEAPKTNLLEKVVLNAKALELHIQKEVHEIGKILTHQSREAVEQMTVKMSDITGGLPGGAKWLDGCSNKVQNDWKQLAEHAKKTILKESGVAKLKAQLRELDAASHLELTSCISDDIANTFP